MAQICFETWIGKIVRNFIFFPPAEDSLVVGVNPPELGPHSEQLLLTPGSPRGPGRILGSSQEYDGNSGRVRLVAEINLTEACREKRTTREASKDLMI